MSEAVNHPKHYQKEGRKECIKEMEERFGLRETGAFALLSAYKYLYRAGEKEGNSKRQDIEKARWYFNYANNLHCSSTKFYQQLNLIKEELANVES